MKNVYLATACQPGLRANTSPDEPLALKSSKRPQIVPVRYTNIKGVNRKPSLRPMSYLDLSLRAHPRSKSIEKPRDNLFSGSISEYKIGEQLGSGAYATVKSATNTTQERFAIKSYEKTKLLDPQRKKNVLTEIKILKSLNHPHIIKLKQAIDSPKHLHLVMEQAGVSLYSFLKERPNRKVNESLARRYFSQLLSGISYCHSQNIIHRDIKLENILLDALDSVKIIDFGFGNFVSTGFRDVLFCGTPTYMAPEIVGKRENPGKPADIWALGVVLYVMLTGSYPFKSASDRELFKLILKGSFEIPVWVSMQAKALIRRLLQLDPRKRPSCEEILKDSWVKGAPRDCNFYDVSFSENEKTKEYCAANKENCK